MNKDFRIVKRRGGIYEEFAVDGLDELDRELHRMAKEMATQKGHRAVTASMMPVAGEVRKNITTGVHSKQQNKSGGPGIYDTGSLLKSVRVVPQRFKGQTKNNRVYADVRAGTDRRGTYKSGDRKGLHYPFYALQVEYGTENSAFGPLPEQPFMRPAFDGNERRIAYRLRQLLRNQIVKWKLTGR